MTDGLDFGVWQYGNWLGELHVRPNGKIRMAWWDHHDKAVRVTRRTADALAAIVGHSAEARRIP